MSAHQHITTTIPTNHLPGWTSPTSPLVSKSIPGLAGSRAGRVSTG